MHLLSRICAIDPDHQSRRRYAEQLSRFFRIVGVALVGPAPEAEAEEGLAEGTADEDEGLRL